MKPVTKQASETYEKVQALCWASRTTTTRLTDEQKQKFRESFRKGAERMQQIFQEHKDEFRNILTDEQKKKFDEAIATMRKRFRAAEKQ